MTPRGGRRLTYAEVTAVLRRFQKAKPWPAEKVERRDPVEYQRKSEVAISMCSNPFCRNWTPKRLTHCVVCHATNEDHSPCRS